MVALFQNREFFALALASFLLSFVAGMLVFLRSRNAAKSQIFRVSETFFLALGCAALSWALFRRGFSGENFLVGNVFEIFQLLGWCSVCSVVFLRAVWSLRVPAVFATGTAAVLCLLGFLNVAAWDTPPTGTGNPWIGVHVALATFGYAGFTAAAIAWIAYLLQNFALRKRRTHRFFSKLPDLESLDRIAGRMCAAGVFFLGFALILGALTLFGGGRLGSTLAVYKISFSVVIFAFFALLVFLRRARKISAKLCARLGLLVFFTALVFLGGIACVHKADEKGKNPEGKTLSISEEEGAPESQVFEKSPSFAEERDAR